jgi:hypothetical protein
MPGVQDDGNQDLGLEIAALFASFLPPRLRRSSPSTCFRASSGEGWRGKKCRAAEYESRFPPRMGASSFVSTVVFGVLSLPVGFREN